MSRCARLRQSVAGVVGMLALATACRAGAGMPPLAAGHTGGDALVRRPAQQLALALADLPPGFRVGEELAPPIARPEGMQDPWGRLSSYSVTYLAGPDEAQRAAPDVGDVVSTVNAYAGPSQARAAFVAWQAAVPSVYRLLGERPGRAPEGVAVYVQDGGPACLVGFRTHNVMASVWVSAAPGASAAPVEVAVRLAQLVAQRIEAVAGH